MQVQRSSQRTWVALALAFALGCGGTSLSGVDPVTEESPGSDVQPSAVLPVPGKAKVTGSGGGLNLRSGPGTSYSVLLVIPEGTEVDVVGGPSGSFYQLTYSGKTGWSHERYLVPISGGGGGGMGIWKPKPGTSWQWQLSGSLDTSLNVTMYDIDLFNTPVATIDSLRARGKKVICYFSAGSYEKWRPDSSRFPAAAIGKVMDGWPDERWVDVRSSALRDIMKARLDLAKTKHCDGVEPDNVDGYANDTGFSLTAANQLDYNRFLAKEAHARGLSIGLKNDLDQIGSLLADYDWALNEECFQYDECDTLLPFIRAGKAVFQVEYGDRALANRICPKANGMNFDTLVKNLDLTASRISCR